MKIKKITTAKAVPGMIVADDIYTDNNQKIISKDTYLTDRIITRLKFYAIREFTITEPEDKDKAPIEKKQLSYSERVRNTIEFKKFNSTFLATAKEFKASLDSIINVGSEVNIDNLLTETNTILSHCRNGLHVFDMLHNMRNYDDLTYAHSLNVALISNVFGKWLHFSNEDIETLTLAGLLHDVGKLMIPSEIITKPQKLTDREYATVKTHAMRGYYILKGKDVSEHVKNAALMHHEKCDGSGYPQGLKGNQIDEFAKIIAIADVYDAMTSARIYRGPLCPFEVLGIFEDEGYQKYETKYLLTFFEEIVLTYMHNQVRLSNGLEGEIIMLNKTSPSRPTIHVGDGFINLAEQRDLFITEIL